MGFICFYQNQLFVIYTANDDKLNNIYPHWYSGVTFLPPSGKIKI